MEKLIYIGSRLFIPSILILLCYCIIEFDIQKVVTVLTSNTQGSKILRIVMLIAEALWGWYLAEQYSKKIEK